MRDLCGHDSMVWICVQEVSTEEGQATRRVGHRLRQGEAEESAQQGAGRVEGRQ